MADPAKVLDGGMAGMSVKGIDAISSVSATPVELSCALGRVMWAEEKMRVRGRFDRPFIQRTV